MNPRLDPGDPEAYSAFRKAFPQSILKLLGDILGLETDEGLVRVVAH
jgi:hypothetical protein